MLRLLCLTIPLSATIPASADEKDVSRCVDPNLTVELFAKSPDIVHPVGLDFDAKGRLLVIESHTHFPPGDYKGPKHDRIRVIEDTDGDGKADRFTSFHEGTKKTMDIAVHPDGSVYLATRNEILRLRDTDGDGKADDVKRVMFLETKGDYPHNGLSGLCFDSRGDLYFGMGENLGAEYKLIGSDGTTHQDEGEGGNVFWCTADGKKLRRVATGFWNPFGICRDIRERYFVVDNDPDAMPPCRMLHLVEGGDYGYQFRYGRSGRHPFQCWDGQLPGTLPMMAGTGEAPCEILSYESDGLPSEYRGDLLVTSWADHRVERYVAKERGASFSGERKPFVQGGKDFRPVGLAVAPDGSLFVSDWVLSNYQLHGKGAIWHIRPKKPAKVERPTDPAKGLFSMHRPLRDAAARKLAESPTGRDLLRKHLTNEEVRVRAACRTALLAAQAPAALNEKEPTTHELLRMALDADPFVRHGAIRQLARRPKELSRLRQTALADPRQRVALLLACCWPNAPRATATPSNVSPSTWPTPMRRGVFSLSSGSPTRS
jgi:putative membrane-bound dehydrogenase-like protein